MAKIVIADKFLDFISKFNGRMDGITIYPYIFLRSNVVTDATVINHENIHIEQQKETLLIGFFLIYGISFLMNCISGQDSFSAYLNIIFEREAYTEQDNEDYLKQRKRYAWIFS